MSKASKGTEQGMRRWLVPALVVLAAVLVHAQSVTYGFVRWDDPEHVTANPLVIAPSTVSFLDQLRTPGLGYPIPVTIFTYRVEKALFGLAHPGAFHATNVLLHALACLLAFQLARRIGLGVPGAALATLVFGLHPVVVEPVTWVTGRKDLLALVFGLASLHYAMPGPPEEERERSVGAFAFFTLALFSKPVAAYLVPVIALSRWMFAKEGARPDVRSIVRGIAPYVAVVAVVFVIAVRGQSAVGALETKSLGLYVRDIVYALGFHLGLLFFLHEPTAKYFPEPYPSPFDPLVDLVPIAFGVAVALAMRALPRERRRAPAFALFFAAAAYLPNSNLLPLTRFLADSYVYAPLVGLGWFLGAIFDHALERLGDRAARARVAVPVVVSLVLAVASVRSAPRFHDSVSLWAHVYARYKDYRICQNLSTSYYETTGADDVLRVTDECIARFGPEHFAKNRGIALFVLGRIDESDEWFERAARYRERDGEPPDTVILLYQARIALARRRGRGAPVSNSPTLEQNLEDSDAP